MQTTREASMAGKDAITLKKTERRKSRIEANHRRKEKTGMEMDEMFETIDSAILTESESSESEVPVEHTYEPLNQA